MYNDIKLVAGNVHKFPAFKDTKIEWNITDLYRSYGNQCSHLQDNSILWCMQFKEQSLPDTVAQVINTSIFHRTENDPSKLFKSQNFVLRELDLN